MSSYGCRHYKNSETMSDESKYSIHLVYYGRADFKKRNYEKHIYEPQTVTSSTSNIRMVGFAGIEGSDDMVGIYELIKIEDEVK